VKIIELSLWSGDFLLGHLLLFMLAPPILLPYADSIHSTMLFWLRPSKQIRPPLYTLKQRKQRRVIIAKYGLVFIFMFAIFAALIALPAVFRETLDLNCPFCDMI